MSYLSNESNAFIKDLIVFQNAFEAYLLFKDSLFLVFNWIRRNVIKMFHNNQSNFEVSFVIIIHFKYFKNEEKIIRHVRIK